MRRAAGEKGDPIMRFMTQMARSFCTRVGELDCGRGCDTI